ncbi:MAG: hypothetical protein KA116_12710 [Proteobacteria bacterium]|nr:hypothetical protein [Pseudomonadota bacterium]
MRWVFKLLSSFFVFCLFQFSTPVFAIHILPAVCDPILEKIAKVFGRSDSRGQTWDALIGKDRADVAREFDKLLPNLDIRKVQSYRDAYSKIKLKTVDKKTFDWMIADLKRFEADFDSVIAKVEQQYNENIQMNRYTFQTPYEGSFAWILANKEAAKARLHASLLEIEKLRINPSANYADFMGATRRFANPFHEIASVEDINSEKRFWNSIAQNEGSVFRSVPQSDVKLRKLSYGWGSGVADIGLISHGEFPRADGRIFTDPFEFAVHDMAHNGSGQTKFSLWGGVDKFVRSKELARNFHSYFADFMMKLPKEEQKNALTYDAIYNYLTHENAHQLLSWSSMLNSPYNHYEGHVFDTSSPLYKEASQHTRSMIIGELKERALNDASSGENADFHWIIRRDSMGNIITSEGDLVHATDYFMSHFYQEVMKLDGF